jgi:hypothetical protein
MGNNELEKPNGVITQTPIGQHGTHSNELGKSKAIIIVEIIEYVPNAHT